MRLLELYKQKMLESLELMLGDKFDKQKVVLYIDNMISKAPKITLWMRNLYTTQNFGVDLNDILDIVKNEDLCVVANGTFTYSFEKMPTPIPKMLIKSKADRNYHKKIALDLKDEVKKLKDAGMSEEETANSPQELKRKVEDAFQLKVKTFMNSIYGVQGQAGSIIYSSDTAGGVTSNGRELISEMSWSIERLLYGTVYFTNPDELLVFLTQMKHEVHEDSPLLSYITYWPTVEDVRAQIVNMIHHTDGIDNVIEELSIGLLNMINSLTPVERVYFYYKSNLHNLIARNPKIFDLFDQMILDPIHFISLDKWNDEKENNLGTAENPIVLKGTGIPPQFVDILKTITTVIDEFVIVHMQTPKRVQKYKTKRRRAVVVSDTDSIMLNLHPYVKNLYKLHCLKHRIPCVSENIEFHDELLAFKLVNIMSYICTFGTQVAGDLICKGMHIPDSLRKWIEMKNEFLFKRMIIYSNAKKNYLNHVRLQEGKVLDDIEKSGIKVKSSVLHPVVNKRILEIVTNRVLKSEHVDPVNVLGDIKELERFIINQIQQGDLTYGRRARYSGPKGYKTGVYQNDAGRSAYIWNLLYPNNRLNVGDYGYIFNTSIVTEKDLEMLSKRFPTEAKWLNELIFNNPQEPKLKPFGLKAIMIPMGNESVKKIPDWIVPYIDYPKLTNKHLQPIITLLPSLGIQLSALSSSKVTYSPLTTFG